MLRNAEEDPSSELNEALDALREHDLTEPEAAIVLGSGLSDIAAAVQQPIVIPTKQIPSYPTSTVEGHKGQLLFGVFEDKPVVIIQGRVHVYEGYTPEQAAFPIRLIAALGASRLILTNAAGGIHPTFHPGTLMLIENHIDATGGPPASLDPFVRTGSALPAPSPYDPEWIDQVQRDAAEASIPLERGVYLWTRGPSYETKAEIRAFGLLGADAVGMSTVPEAVQAGRLGMRLIGVSTITNYAAGLTNAPLNHEDVLRVGRQIQSSLQAVLAIILSHA